MASASLPDACEQLRLVLAPDGRVVADLGGKLPGKSLLIPATREALAGAGALAAETFGENITLPGHLAEQVESGLVKRIQERIAFARKAGEVVCGFAKVEMALKKGRGGVLLEASDGGAADRKKMAFYLKKEGVIMLPLLSRAELGTPFARGEVVHALVHGERLSTEILKEMRRLAGFRKEDTL